MLGPGFLICAILPGVLDQSISRTVSLHDGDEIFLTKREAVNDAGEIPRVETYTLFYGASFRIGKLYRVEQGVV